MKSIAPPNELNIERRAVIHNLIYCARHTRKCYPPLLLWCALLALAGVLMPALGVYFPKAVIDIITNRAGVNALISVTLAFALAIAALAGARQFLDRYVYHHKYKMNAYYLRLVADKGMTTDYANRESQRFQKLQNESVNACSGNYSPLTNVYDVCVSICSNALGFIVYLGALLGLNALVVLFICVTTLCSYFIKQKLIRYIEARDAERISYRQRTDYINAAAGDIKAAKDIRLYNMALWLNKAYEINLKGLSGWYARYTAKLFGVSVRESALTLVRDAAAYAYLIYLAAESRINAADFVMYTGVIAGFSAWLSGILDKFNSLKRINLSVDTLRAYLDYPDAFKRDGGRGVDTLMGAPGTIEMKNVRYRYAGADADALRDINLTIAPGEHLAIVGLNGAGKTTLIKLICGLIDPTEGYVLYDGVDVRQYDRREYYRLFSAVFQQYSLLPVTIAEVVAQTSAQSADMARVISCLERAGLMEMVKTLPNGVNSVCGKAIYDGAELSGGGIQKLLLARALYKQAPIMLLDEPTAALDPISESRLYETYASIMQNRSTVFVSHRLASTRFLNRIILLENGEIIERGSHAELLKQKGRYFDLFETQARYYRDNPAGEGLYECK